MPKSDLIISAIFILSIKFLLLLRSHNIFSMENLTIKFKIEFNQFEHEQTMFTVWLQWHLLSLNIFNLGNLFIFCTG